MNAVFNAVKRETGKERKQAIEWESLTHLLGDTESAILNRESGDSKSGDSSCAIPRSRVNTDRLRFGLAILNRFSAISLHCDSTHFCTSRLGNPGDSWSAMLGIVRFVICDSMPSNSLESFFAHMILLSMSIWLHLDWRPHVYVGQYLRTLVPLLGVHLQ